MKRLLLLAGVGLLVATPAAATVERAGRGLDQASVTAAPAAGPPTSKTVVAGAGFAPGEQIDVFFDTTDVGGATADGSGAFAGAAVAVPGSALPGAHWLSAVGRSSGSSAQTQFLVRANWPSLRGNPAMTGFDPTENLISPATVGGLHLAWSDTVGFVQSISSPAVYDGIVYVATDIVLPHRQSGLVSAVDAITGELRWSRRVDAQLDLATPAAANGVVYVGSALGGLYAFGAKHGRLLWTASTDSFGTGVFSSPTVAGGLVYYPGGGKLFAFDAATGALRWVSPTGSNAINDSSPTVANGLAYITARDGKVHAFDATTGTPAWTSNERGSMGDNTAAVAHGLLYIGAADGTLRALDAATGVRRWRRFLAGRAFATEVFTTPTVGDGMVFVPSDFGTIYALGATAGHPIWSSTAGYAHNPLALAGGVLFARGGAGGISALDAATGAALWSTSERVVSAPVVANGFVYAITQDGRLDAFSTGPPFEAPRPDPPTLVARG